ncbi:hypothetical protein [Streptomyces coeruleorubidus]|uniref:hypothetical protein n=1 Tax=Streptomyces coeruleorubidus TaxID=116188 RepID=UPI0033D07922
MLTTVEVIGGEGEPQCADRVPPDSPPSPSAPTSPSPWPPTALTSALNSYFFAATLAARTEYAPPQARGQVFIWVAALKITSGSAGTALAGAPTGFSVRLPVLAGICAVMAAALTATAEARMSRHDPTPAPRTRCDR